MKNRETARIIKNSFEQQNNIIEANRFYALEMDEREKELNDKNHKDYNILEWLIFKVHKISSNHSQDWLLVLYWIITIGFISSLFNFYLIDKHTISNTIKEYHITIFIISTLFLSIIYYCLKTIPKLFDLVFLFSMYILITHDIHYLSYFANNLNPFSVMKNSDSITIVALVFKITLGYLYYQLIISIRQNTRRK